MGDSDDDEATTILKQKLTKQAKKKLEQNTKAPTKNNDADDFKGATGGGFGEFETTKNDRKPGQGNQKRDGDRPPRRGGKDAARPQTGRGGRGGGFKDGQRPRAGYKTDAEGNQTKEGMTRQRKPYQGETQKDGTQRFDRQDGTGKARRERKDYGDKNYRKKGEGEEEKKGGEEPVEEKKEREPKVQYKEEVIGYSLDDVLAGKKFGGRKEARQAEGVKAKTVAGQTKQEKQSTLLQQQYLKGTAAPTVNENQNLLGMGRVKDDDDEGEDRGARGGRGGRRNQEGGQRGGRRQNAK